MELIGTGAQADAYAKDGHVIKLYRSAEKEDEARFELEQQRKALALGAPAPKAYGYVEIDGLPGVEMEWIKGETLGAKVLENIGGASMYLEMSIDLQIQFHSLHATNFMPLKERVRHKLERAGQLSPRQRKALIDRLFRLPDGDKLCHGDFHLLNLIETENGLIVIDWVDAARGPALADAARTYLLYGLNVQEIAGAYLDIYIEKTGCAKEDILAWLPVLAGARLTEGDPPEIQRTLLKVVDELY